MSFTIKQTADMLGISTDTLRYYDKEGMVSPKRGENGYRYYSETEVLMLKNIIVMKYAHFSITEMKSIEQLYHNEPTDECNEIAKKILTNKVKSLNNQIANFQKITELMKELLAMVDNIDAFIKNEAKIDLFINQIFEDIKNGGKINE